MGKESKDLENRLFTNHCDGYAGRKPHTYTDRFQYDGRSPCGTCAGELCKTPAYYADWEGAPDAYWWPDDFLAPLRYDWIETAD